MIGSPASLVHRLVGLLHPAWSLRLGPLPGGGGGACEEGPDGLHVRDRAFKGRVRPERPIASLSRCRLDGTTIQGVRLAGPARLFTARRARLVEAVAQPGARVTGADLEGLQVEKARLASLEVQACHAAGLRAEGSELGAWILCDLYGARLRDCTVRALVASDLEAATLVGCNLEGADLSGANLRNARLLDCRLEGARVAGADITGLRGLDRATLRAWREQGATRRPALLHLLWSRFLPRAEGTTVHRLVLASHLAALVLGVAGAAWAVLAAIRPPRPPPAPPPPPPLVRTPTEEEVRRTREALQRLREALADAHEDMLARGARSRTWPTIRELQDNRYDVDGDGPGELMEVLVPGGLPENLLTDSQGGVLPYCNEQPDQTTLSGVDTDWHYCERTGRVFAGAGFSGVRTIDW